MIMRDIVQEETTDPSEEISIAGGESTADEGEFTFAIVRYGGIGVLEEYDHHYPVITQL